MRTFVCIYYGRTGSSWLLNSLASVPRVLVPAFEPVEAWAWPASDDEKLAWLEAALAPPAPSDRDALDAWTEALGRSPQFSGLANRNFDVVGFKMSVGAVEDHGRLVRLLDRAGSRLLFLDRRNRIKHALSLYRAHEEQKDQFTKEGSQPPTKVRLRKFDRWVDHSQEVHQALREFRGRCAAAVGEERILDVTYEDYVDDAGKAAVLDRVAGFLGIDAAKVQPSPYRKVTPDDLEAALVNYSAVRRRYAGGPLASFFED